VPGPLIVHALWIATALRLLLPSFADPDLWGHLLFGSLLLSGTLPAVNGFAYTAADHPWMNHEILAEVSMAAVYNLGGAPGLVTLKVAIGLATLLIVWRTARRRSDDAVASSIATAAGASIMAPGLMIRPQIFTLLFLAAVVAELAKHDYRPRGRVWLLPLLVAIWVNTHGGVIAGVGLAGAGVLTALAWRLRRRTVAPGEILRSCVFLALLAGALLLNPYGVALVRFLFLDVTPHVPITEWAPVTLTDLSFPLFKVLLLVAAAQCLRGRTRPEETVVLALAAVAALTHQRHIPLFAIVATPLAATTIAELAHACGTWVPAHAVRRGLTAAAALQLALAGITGVQTGGRIVVDPWTYPVQALRFLAQNDIAGNVALPFRWGEYALWSLPPGSRVAVDGRFTTAYPDDLLAAAWRFMSGEPEWDTLLTDYPTDIVVADRRQAPAVLLRNHEDWEYVYSDPVSVVFIRRVPAQAETLARFSAKQLRYDDAPLVTDFPAVHLPGPPPLAPTAACRLAGRAPTETAPRSPRRGFC
jgi:hypothetical protein